MSETGGDVRCEVLTSCTCVRSLSERVEVLLLWGAHGFFSSIPDSSTLVLFLLAKENKFGFLQDRLFLNLFFLGVFQRIDRCHLYRRFNRFCFYLVVLSHRSSFSIINFFKIFYLPVAFWYYFVIKNLISFRRPNCSALSGKYGKSFTLLITLA